MKSIRKLLTYTKPYKRFVLLAPLLMALEVTMDLLQPFIMQMIIDHGIVNNELDYVIQMGVITIICAIFGLIGGVGCIIYSTKASVNFASDMRSDLFKKVEHFSSENRDHFGVGKLITILINDVSTVQHALMLTLRVFVRGPLLFIGSILIVFFQARELFPILLVLIPILLYFIIFLSKKAGRWFKKVQENMDVLNTKLQESIAGIRVIKAFVRNDYEIKQFNTISQSLKRTQLTAEQVITILMPILLFFVNVGIVLALLFGVINPSNTAIPVGKIVAFINYLNIILMALMSSSMVLMQLMRAFPSADRICEVLETEIKMASEQIQTNSTTVVGNLTFANVSFSYDDNYSFKLKNLSFSLKEGETVGIIGPTGSGKTTIAKLLARMYDVCEGQILLDGKNIKEIDVQQLRSSIGFVTQKPFLFSGTIDHNVKYGKTSASEQEVEVATQQACASEFIEKLEGRYQYELKQEATNLSGGQKQRLSIARALIRKPAILVLDDVTSAVDAVSEKNILNALAMDFQRTTKLIISSKISSIIAADKIIVLDNGEVAGIGSHAQLLKECSLYQQIYETQVEQGGVVVE